MTRRHSPFLVCSARALGGFVGVLGLSATLAACSSSPPPASTTSSATASCAGVRGTHHARVVVEASSAKIVSSCVGFSTPTISAVSLLDHSHIQIGTQKFSFGLAICQADDVPSHYSSCLSSSGPYWALFTSQGGAAWQQAQVGVSDVTMHPGDSLGLRYDPQSGTAAPPPAPAPA